MSTIKAVVLADVRARLQKELSTIHTELNDNRRQMKKLVERQTVLKREVPALYNLLRSITPLPEKKVI